MESYRIASFVLLSIGSSVLLRIVAGRFLFLVVHVTWTDFDLFAFICFFCCHIWISLKPRFKSPWISFRYLWMCNFEVCMWGQNCSMSLFDSSVILLKFKLMVWYLILCYWRDLNNVSPVAVLLIFLTLHLSGLCKMLPYLNHFLVLELV